MDDDRATLVPCLACGGEFRRVYEDGHGRYRSDTCRWCIQGAMTQEQIAAWRAFSDKRTDPQLRSPAAPERPPDPRDPGRRQ